MRDEKNKKKTTIQHSFYMTHLFLSFLFAPLALDSTTLPFGEWCVPARPKDCKTI